MAGGFMDAIGSMFRPTQQVTLAPGQQGMQQQGTQQQGQQQQVPSSQLQQPDQVAGINNPGNLQADPDNPNNPMHKANPGSPQGNNSPLANWTDLWKTDPKATPPANPWDAPILSMDSGKMATAISGMNMMDGVPQELMQKLQGGDMTALPQVINHVMQSNMMRTMQMMQASVEHAGKEIKGRFDKTLPDQFREFQFNNLPTDHQAFNDPGVQQLLNNTRQQMKAKNPDWSATQIHNEAQKYVRALMTTFGNAFANDGQNNGNANSRNSNPNNRSDQEQDWSSFL